MGVLGIGPVFRPPVARLDAATSGRIRMAIDVFPEEPIPAAERARTTPETILSAHRGGNAQCERMLVEDGILLLKYWFSVSDEEQEHRFQARLGDPTRRWKLRSMNLHSRHRFVDFSRAKDEMFFQTDTDVARSSVVEADVKRNARRNYIVHLLSMVPYEVHEALRLDLPKRQPDQGYVRPDRSTMTRIPEYTATLLQPPH